MISISDTARIQREIAQQAGLNVLVEEDDGVLVLTGIVDSTEARQAAEDIATTAAPWPRIQNDLEVETELPVDVGDFQAGESIAEVAENMAELATADGALEPDFTDLPLETSPSEADSGAEPMFAATDPVITVDEHGLAHVLGGFSSDSMASLDVEPSAEDTLPGDEALVEAVRRELKEDAATTSLDIDVFVRRGIVHLRGWVPGAEDVDNAEAVAERVPGVREVVDELELPVM
jgi:osmotically-inducible protein OsmY